ncbi:hypothetical protein C8Q80DRAFT_25978 [Daedaleopsis nitida]|nr:hypothetical protein C8Q80DRAFT_25978 [Daedaleopsis nitida]
MTPCQYFFQLLLYEVQCGGFNFSQVTSISDVDDCVSAWNSARTRSEHRSRAHPVLPRLLCTEHYLAALLSRGVRVLIYVGAGSPTGSATSTRRSSSSGLRTGMRRSAEPLRQWFVDGEVAGQTRRFDDLTFATIREKLAAWLRNSNESNLLPFW